MVQQGASRRGNRGHLSPSLPQGTIRAGEGATHRPLSLFYCLCCQVAGFPPTPTSTLGFSVSKLRPVLAAASLAGDILECLPCQPLHPGISQVGIRQEQTEAPKARPVSSFNPTQVLPATACRGHQLTLLHQPDIPGPGSSPPFVLHT